MAAILDPYNGAGYAGTTPAQQEQNPNGLNGATGFLSQYSPTGNLGKINSEDAFTGLINRLIQTALVETWDYESPYYKYARTLPTDLVNKVVQIVASKPLPGWDFDPLAAGRILERRIPEQVQFTYGINFDRQYMVTIQDYLLKRGADASAALTIVGQQIKNTQNQREVELTEFINEIIGQWVINNFNNLININFDPADPDNPTQDELVLLSRKIDRAAMDMTRFVGSNYALSDVGFTTPYDRLVLDTTSVWPAGLTNSVLPWAFHNESFSTFTRDTARTDGRASDRVNVLRWLPQGIYGIVRDREMLTIGQAFNSTTPDPTGIPATRSYNVFHNFAAAVFMDVTKRGFIISQEPDSVPETITVQLSGINAQIVDANGKVLSTAQAAPWSEVSLATLALPLSLKVTPTGAITPNNKGVALPAGHVATPTVQPVGQQDTYYYPKGIGTVVEVTSEDLIKFNDKIFNPVKGTAFTAVNIQFDVDSTYINPQNMDETPPSYTIGLTLTP